MMSIFNGFYGEISGWYEEGGIRGESKNQDARYVLPNAAETKITTTMNGRELLHLFNQRCCNRAQWEIRKLAKEMFKLSIKVAPSVLYEAGPNCVVHGRSCLEGNLACGKQKDVISEFEKIKAPYRHLLFGVDK